MEQNGLNNFPSERIIVITIFSCKDYELWLPQRAHTNFKGYFVLKNWVQKLVLKISDIQIRINMANQLIGI